MKEDDLFLWKFGQMSRSRAYSAAAKGKGGIAMSAGEIAIRAGNTVGWYCADDTANITKDGSNLVSKWADKLLSGHDLIQTTTNLKPVWGSGGITFDGATAGDQLKSAPFTLAQPIFIYALIKQITWTSNDMIWDGNTTNAMSFVQVTTTPRVTIYVPSSQLDNSTATLGKYQIVRALYNGSNSSLQIDNLTKATGTVGTGAAGGFTLGGAGARTDFGSNIQVAEVIIRTSTDTGGVADDIYNYLETRKLLF